MKTINFILTGLLLIIFAGNTNAQEQLPYKAKAEFKGDTLQYLEYNFTKRSSQYVGKKVSDVLKDLELKVLHIAEHTGTVGGSPSTSGRLISLSLTVHQVEDKPNIHKDYYITVLFEDPPSSAEYRAISGFSRENRNPVFTQKLYDFIKDRKVKIVHTNEFIIKDPEIQKTWREAREKHAEENRLIMEAMKAGRKINLEN